MDSDGRLLEADAIVMWHSLYDDGDACPWTSGDSIEEKEKRSRKMKERESQLRKEAIARWPIRDSRLERVRLRRWHGGEGSAN
jgi:hypothetical protein